MDEPLAAPGIRLRDFRWEDLPAFVEIRNRSFPDMPQTRESAEHFEHAYPPDNPRRRYAVDAAGTLVGVGVGDVPIWLDAPGVYRFYAVVDPAWRGRGIGQALLARLEQYAGAQGAARLISDCRENMSGAIRFLERSGFQQFGLRFEAVADLTAFDESRFAGAIDRVAEAGYELTTLAAERPINPNADRDLYDLDELVSQDIPWPGGLKASMTYDNFRRVTFDNPEADPAAIFIAKRDGVYAGYTSVSFRAPHLHAPHLHAPHLHAPHLRAPHLGHTGMTGVRREHRGHGLALALKLLSFRLMKERGCTETMTHNDSANQAILALNRQLGYQQRPGILLWSKPLTPQTRG